MINHAYTLLLNRSAQYVTGLVNCPYIPSEFKPVTLTPELSAVRSALIPLTNSKQQEVDVVGIITKVLHSADLEPYVLSLDKRITYTQTPVEPIDLAPSHLDLTMTSSGGCDVVPKYKFTTPALLRPVAGTYTWRVTSVDANNVRVRNTKNMEDTVKLNPKSTSTKSLSVEIIPGYMSIYFTLPSMYFTGTFQADYTLTVTASYDLAGAMVALKQALSQGSGTFNYNTGAEVMPVLKDIWLHHPALVTQFGAGVLAYIYTLDSRLPRS